MQKIFGKNMIIIKILILPRAKINDTTHEIMSGKNSMRNYVTEHLLRMYYARITLLRTYYGPITHLLPYYAPITRLLRAYYPITHLLRAYYGPISLYIKFLLVIFLASFIIFSL